MIFSLLSIRSLGANREKPVVLLHQLVNQHVAHQSIAGAGEVHVIALAQARLYPLANGSGAAHARPPVPECAAIFERDLPLDLDHFIHMRKRLGGVPR